jgi:hypothetical protein
MDVRILIDSDKLPQDDPGGSIAVMLRSLADSMEDNGHFDPANHINGHWGACPLLFAGKNVGALEII